MTEKRKTTVTLIDIDGEIVQQTIRTGGGYTPTDPDMPDEVKTARRVFMDWVRSLDGANYCKYRNIR